MRKKDPVDYSGKLIVLLQSAIAVLVWVYIIYRAVFFEIIQDEAYSYALVKTNYWKALPGTYNTHWLNSFAMKFFLLLPGGDHVWKLRMLSMLAWGLFAFSVIGLGRRFSNSFIGILFFALCVFNPTLILFFSLGRGYAAGCALLFFSLWLAGKRIDRQIKAPQQWMPVFAIAALAVLANFSLLYFFLGLVIVYLFYIILSDGWKLLFTKISFGWLLLVTGTAFFSIACLLFIKYYTKEPEIDGKASIIAGPFGSPINEIGYQFLPMGFTGIISFTFFLAAACFAVYKIMKEKKMAFSSFAAFICAAVLTLNGFFHMLFHTAYLYGRAALFFYCLCMLAICELFDQPWFFSGYRKTITTGFGLILLTGILFNNYQNINTRHFSEWPVQNKTKEALDYLTAVNAKNVGLDLWQYSVLKNYYSKAFPNKYFFTFSMVDKNITRADSLFRYDYLLLSQPPKDSNNSWQTKLYYPAIGTTILKYTGK